MLRIKRCGSAILAIAALGIFVPNALGAAAPGSNGCNGNIVATFNHNSGSFGASGNPNSSAGPGYFEGGASPGSVSGAVQGARGEFCS
jgi:hypothetical protein